MRHQVKVTEVITGLVESNGSLPPGEWLKVTCGLTACTPGSAPGPTLGNEYGKTLPLPFTFRPMACKPYNVSDLDKVTSNDVTGIWRTPDSFV